MPQQTSLCSALEAKLEIAEKLLFYSNRNIELTMRIWIEDRQENDQFPIERADNMAQIACLVQQLRALLQSEDELQLLDAATPVSSSSIDFGEFLHRVTDGLSSQEARAATANVAPK